MAGKYLKKQDPPYKLSAAIDFGTSNCAVAYSYASDKDNVIVINNWSDGVDTQGKIPTAILFDKYKHFVSFGNQAIDKYKEIASDCETENYYFFQNFKMELYKQISKGMKLRDANGKEMIALDVFTAAIKFMREYLLKELNKRGVKKEDLNIIEIAWVITVPAIWNNAAKQFMRDAAEKAGCQTSFIKIALESEVASVYCQNNANYNFKKVLEIEGAKFLVVDIGGGTLDITAHQYLGSDKMKEIYHASGRDLGGNGVDHEFIKHLENVFGQERIQKIKQRNPKAWILFLEDFEKAKKTVSISDAEDLVYLNSFRGCSWGRKRFTFKKARNKSNLKLKRDGRLYFPQLTILNIIIQLSIRIKDLIEVILNDLELKSIDAILLVGGFAKSPFIRDALEKLVDNKIPVIEPEKSELCVVKGAVLLGWKTDLIQSRKSRYTYGFGACRVFDEEKDDLSRRWTDGNGKIWCKNCFHKLITINDDLPIDNYVEHTAFHLHNELPFTWISLFCTQNPNPKYSDVEGVDLVDQIKLSKRKGDDGKKIVLRLFFRETGIHIETIEKDTRNIFKVSF